MTFIAIAPPTSNSSCSSSTSSLRSSPTRSLHISPPQSSPTSVAIAATAPMPPWPPRPPHHGRLAPLQILPSYHLFQVAFDVELLIGPFVVTVEPQTRRNSTFDVGSRCRSHRRRWQSLWLRLCSNQGHSQVTVSTIVMSHTLDRQIRASSSQSSIVPLCRAASHRHGYG
jgi:hypothetical protein